MGFRGLGFIGLRGWVYSLGFIGFRGLRVWEL